MVFTSLKSKIVSLIIFISTISVDNPQSMFVTLFIGIMGVKTGPMVLSNGGQNPSIQVSRSGECHYIQKISGPAAGVMEPIPSRAFSLDLVPGEAVFLYADGVTETQNPNKEFYSDEPLLEKVSGLVSATSKEKTMTIQSDLKALAVVEPQFDDIAMLMNRYREDAHEA